MCTTDTESMVVPLLAPVLAPPRQPNPKVQQLSMRMPRSTPVCERGGSLEAHIRLLPTPHLPILHLHPEGLLQVVVAAAAAAVDMEEALAMARVTGRRAHQIAAAPSDGYC